METHVKTMTAAAEAMVRRLLGERADDVVVTIVEPDSTGAAEFGEAEADNGVLRLAGTNGVAVAVALRQYLEQACGTQVTWLDEPIRLPDRWPDLPRFRATARYPLRYHLNYVTFAYSAAFWDWQRWEREIDRMALHGINAPLAITGHEAVWQAVLRAEGMSDERIAAYLGGSTYLPFLWMGCLEGWDRPLPEGWIAARERLGQQIVARERELGMRPVLPGFAGHVPAELADEGAAKLQWEGFHTRQLPADHPRFMAFAQAVRAEQRARFGGDGLYATDPFIEMVPPSGEPEALADMARRILDGVTVDDPDAVWVFQAWPFSYRSEFWTPERVRAFLDAVPPERLLVLDLWAEHAPLWSSTDRFADRPWLWCIVHNFGQRSGLFGDVRALVRRFRDAEDGAAADQLRGIGLAMEGLGTNPAVYDLVTDLAWREPPDDLESWLTAWAQRRYGTDDDRVREIWRVLAATVYGPGRDVLVPSPVIRRPGLDDQVSAAWAPDDALGELVHAWRLMLDVADVVSAADAYRRDLVDLTVQVVGGLAGRSRRAVTAAVAKGDRAGALHAGARLLELLHDLDDILATRAEYLLGRWIAEARDWGATPTERLHLERSVRRLLTVWGHPNTNLYDYSWRHWAGLMREFYIPRLQVWLDWIADGGAVDDPTAAVDLDRRLASFEQLWIADGAVGPVEPRGDAVGLAARLFDRWSGHVADDQP